MRYVDRKFVRIAPAPGYTSRLVISVAETPTDVWMGPRSWRVRATRRQAFEPRGLPDRKVNCLLAGDSDALWIGTTAGWRRGTAAKSHRAVCGATANRSGIGDSADRDSNVGLERRADCCG